MPILAPEKIKPRRGQSSKATETQTPSMEAPVDRGARLLAEAITAFAEPTHSRPARRATSINQAVTLIARAVPRSIRLAALREVQKAIDASIKAAETEAPSARSSTSKVQQENDDFMAEMRAQSSAAREKDIASKKLLTSREMADRLHRTTAAVTAAVRSHRMFTLAGPGGNYYPAFFADEKFDRNVLEKVSKTLGEVSGGSKWEFFTSPRHSLNGKTPLEALAKGHVEAVLAAAAAFRDE